MRISPNANLPLPQLIQRGIKSPCEVPAEERSCITPKCRAGRPTAGWSVPRKWAETAIMEIPTGTQLAVSTRSSRATCLSHALPAQRSSSAPGFGQVSPGPDPPPFSRPIPLHIYHLRKTNVLVGHCGCYPGLEPGSSPLSSLKIGFVVRRLETGMELRMKESHRKGVANHLDPESCVASREAAIEA